MITLQGIISFRETAQLLMSIPPDHTQTAPSTPLPTATRKESLAKRKALWIGLGILGSLSALYFLFYLMVYWGVFGKLPNEAALSQINQPLASEVYSADGVLLGKYFIQNRSYVEFDDISPALIDALLCTEDVRFYEHKGVDRRSMARVLFKSVMLQNKSSGGGSTISQQLAKNLFPRKNFGIFSMPINKMKEIIVARRLERLYEKEEILSLYLNTVSFGEDAYGIGTAAQRFFGKSPAELPIEASATLVGMLKATSYYNPRLHEERAVTRRNVVLSQMQRYEKLTAAEQDSLSQLPLGLNYKRFSSSKGLAPYFRAHLQQQLKQILADIPNSYGQPSNLFKDGLKIYTTIDSRMQAHADAAVKAHMRELQELFHKHWGEKDPWGKDTRVIERAVVRSDRYQQLQQRGLSPEEIQDIFKEPVPMKIFSWEGEMDTVLSPLDSVIYYQSFLNAGFVAIDPHSSEIKAWTGGIDHRYFKYDHVTAHRQVGSTFKPFVYATALEVGADPCEYVANELTAYPEYENWTPQNADGQYGGFYSMEGGLSRSVNTVTVNIMMTTGPREVIRFARRMGIERELPEEPSIALGTAELSLLELLQGYAPFANGGFRIAPFFLTRIEDRSGQIVYETELPDHPERVLPDSIVMMTRKMLETTVDSGTARRIRTQFGIAHPVAGKTGTTQDNADGWFVGFTPRLLAGAWVGAEDQKVHFRSTRLGQGARTALPIWARFMQAVYKDPDLKGHVSAQFAPLPDELLEKMDCMAYRLEEEDTQIFLDDLFKHWREQRQERRNNLEERREELRKKRLEWEREQIDKRERKRRERAFKKELRRRQKNQQNP